MLSHQEDIDADTNPDEFILTGSLAEEEEDPEKDLKRKREEEVLLQGDTILYAHSLKQLVHCRDRSGGDRTRGDDRFAR